VPNVTPSMNKMFGANSSNTGPDSLITRFYDPSIRAPDVHGRTLESILDWPDMNLERSHNYIQILFPLPEGSPYNFSAPVIDRHVMEAFHARPELRNRLKQALVRILHFYGFEVATRAEFEKREAEKAKEQARDEEESSKEQETDVQQSSTDVEAPEAQETHKPSDVAIASDDRTTSPKPSSGLPSDFIVLRASHFPTASRNWAVRMDHNHLRISRILRCLRVLGLQKECAAYYSALQDVYNDPEIRIGERSMEYWTKAAKQELWIAPDGERCRWLNTWVEEQEAKVEAATRDHGQDGKANKKAKIEATEDADVNTKTTEVQQKD
jgi:hypothetical protein